MKKQNGITLLSVIITVVLVLIISGLAINNGIDTYKNSEVAKFEAYMKVIQKKVDITIEEGVKYSTLGSELTVSQQATLQEIINNDSSGNIQTESSMLTSLRYFSTSDLETYFDIKDVNDDIVVNFANREVISLNGIEKDEVMHYVEKGMH